MSRLLQLLAIVAVIASSVFLITRLKAFYWPGNQQGYEPEQPIAFSHALHAGKLEISCLYCHGGAEQSKHAGFPAASLCMNCHRLVTASHEAVFEEYQKAQQTRQPAKQVISPELKKLYDALALDDKLERDPGKKQTPIVWKKVHNLPAFTCFDHRAHVTAGVTCQHCHGPVETMERVRQFSNLSMGWCVNCHRETKLTGVNGKQPSTDCSACHH